MKNTTIYVSVMQGDRQVVMDGDFDLFTRFLTGMRDLPVSSIKTGKQIIAQNRTAEATAPPKGADHDN